MGKIKQKNGHKPRKKKMEITFNDADRQEYLTGFHKRKVERRKAAIEEIKQKLKEEHKKMKEERCKEYMKMLKERTEALEEASELDQLVTATTESVQYDHPNHTVTVTTVSDLDLTGPNWFTLGANETEQDKEEDKEEKGKDKEDWKPSSTVPKKAGDPLLSKKISSLMASLHARTKKKKKGKSNLKVRTGKSAPSDMSKSSQRHRSGKSSKAQRRKRTGRNRQQCD
ncbi:nucleolar protein 12 [Erpetoichthys calabaricus]|uniref:nucleolar protein 12 n=1 Tax=Erpetoichthys calabaricus TaxID=27687 RepID=UPI0022342D67|nr:nucleolar protein 12 [Erpetoichthys calabaricus]